MKKCTKCKQLKSLDKFALNKNFKDGHDYRCKLCHNIYKKELYYGLSKEQYLSLLVSQDHKCPICSTHLHKTKAHVDHSHTTGKIRKILCSNCNTGLGKFQENPVFLKKAAKYLGGK